MNSAGSYDVESTTQDKRKCTILKKTKTWIIPGTISSVIDLYQLIRALFTQI